MLKRVKDIAVIIRDGVKEGVRNLSGKLEEYFDEETREMLSQCSAEVAALEKEQLLPELIICRYRMIRAERRITVYGSLFFLLSLTECTMLARNLSLLLPGFPNWVIGIALVVELLLFWALIGKQYRSRRRCSMKAEMLVDRRGKE